MRFYNYNPEKKEKDNSDIYIKAIVFGIIIALLFIGGGNIIVFLIKAIVKYWAWVFGGILVLVLLKRFFNKKSISKSQQQRGSGY